MLEARGIKASDGWLIGLVKGEVEKEDNVLVIKRIHVHYQLITTPDKYETAERGHKLHAQYCPIAKTISGCVDITTSLEFLSP